MHYLFSVTIFNNDLFTSTASLSNWPGVGSYLPTKKDRGSVDVPSDAFLPPPQAFDALIKPVREFVGRDSKQVRAQLVGIGFDLSRDSEAAATGRGPLLECLACVVEALHAGSLVIDDIQDASDVRRGEPSLHRQIGVPLAINAANWLYFWPAELIRKQNLDSGMELEIYRLFHATMTRAHYGQALDLGHDMTQVPQDHVRDISLATIELKTGELMAMCAELGAIAGDASPERRANLAMFGRRFGVALQMFNDIAEVAGAATFTESQVSFRRPSWLWAVAANELDPDEYSQFQLLMKIPDVRDDHTTLSQHPVVAQAITLACAEMKNTMNLVAEITGDPKSAGHEKALHVIKELARKVMSAYA
jgi:geranylgeranyl pyrophosphate synthase